MPFPLCFRFVSYARSMSSYIPGVDIKALQAPHRVYCDVDGVAALFYSETDFDELFRLNLDMETLGNSYARLNNCVFFELEPRSVDISWNSYSTEKLSELSWQEDVDFIWLTTWRHEAPNKLDNLFNIHSAGYLEWNDQKGSDIGKLDALLKAESINPSQKFVWIDDTATTEQAEKQFMSLNFEYITRTPRSAEGITPTDIQQIQQFFKEGK
jgi:pullulanase/glycogen debranching enzyme